MTDITKDYGKLLVKYCKDEELIELIEQCIIHEYETRERVYEETEKLNLVGRYPEKRDLLMKLKSDLNNMKHYLLKQAIDKGGKL